MALKTQSLDINRPAIPDPDSYLGLGQVLLNLRVEQYLCKIRSLYAEWAGFAL